MCILFNFTKIIELEIVFVYWSQQKMVKTIYTSMCFLLMHLLTFISYGFGVIYVKIIWSSTEVAWTV